MMTTSNGDKPDDKTERKKMLNDSLLNGPKSVTIQANKFKDVYGNTYHVVKVTVTGHNGARVSKVSDITYGYGTSYLCTAAKILGVDGYIGHYFADNSIPWRDMDNGYGLKRDLYNFNQ